MSDGYRRIKSESVPEEMKRAAESGECTRNFHVFDGKAKPGDVCLCGKDVFLPELVKDRRLQ
jgi:hypothetical protein